MQLWHLTEKKNHHNLKPTYYQTDERVTCFQNAKFKSHPKKGKIKNMLIEIGYKRD